MRPCVDYRKVNELVKPEGFLLPRIRDCLDAVAGLSLFSTFDLTSGYFQTIKRRRYLKECFPAQIRALQNDPSALRA